MQYRVIASHDGNRYVWHDNSHYEYINSFAPGCTIWYHRTYSVLVQAVACGLWHDGTKAINWIDVYLSSTGSCDIRLRIVLQEMDELQMLRYVIRINLSTCQKTKLLHHFVFPTVICRFFLIKWLTIYWEESPFCRWSSHVEHLAWD